MHPFNINADSLANSIIDWLNNILTRAPGVIFGLLVGIILVRILVRLSRYILKFTTLQKGFRQIIASGVETLLWLLLTIQVLQWLGFSNILVFLSSSTLAIGILLAAGGSTLLSDLIAGIFLARDGDFNVGDEVTLGENRTQGIIESMDVRRVRVRDEEGQLHILPNSLAERKEWVVITRRQQVATPLAKATKAARRFREATVEKTVQRRAKKKANLE